MRKNVIIPAFAAALALVSCVKTNELPAPVETRTVSFHAVSPDTKAVFTAPEGNQYPVLWTANDTKVNVIQNYKTVGTVDITRSADNKTATFEAELTTGAAENYLVAVSPASAVASISNSEERINFEVPSGQECSSASPDEKAMILVAKKDLGAELPKTESLTFNHFTGYLHLMFSNYASALSDANVQSVSITSAKDISGRVYYYPKNDDIVPNAMSKTVSVTPENLDNVWVGLAPVDLSSEKISITVSTDKGTLTKELTFPANRNLTSGKIANIPVDMSGISLVAPVKYKLVKGVDELHVGDKIIIAAANYDRAVSATQKTNNRDAADIVKDGEYIIDPSDAVEIIELEEGLKPGEYAFKATLKPGYLSALSGGNLLKTESTINEYGSFAISIEPTAKDPETEASVSYAATVYAKASDHYFRYNNLWNSSTSSYNNLFSAYSSSSKTKFINLYRLEEPADASLRFKVTMPDADDAGAVTVPAAGKELEVYVFGNTPWTASVTGGATLSSTSGNGNSIIKLTVPENTSTTDTPSYTVTVTTTATVAKDTYTFTVNQVAAPSGEGPKVGDVLWAEWWTGGVKDQLPSAYGASESKTTTVYGGGSVTYTQSPDNTQLKDDALVYYKSAPSSYDAKYKFNLLIRSKNGYLNVAGIPCTGVKKATLTYRSNQKVDHHTVTTKTTGVTAGSLEVSTGTTLDETDTKNLYTMTCEFTIDSGVNEFDLRITDINTSTVNIRVDGLELVVTEVW